MDQNGALSGAGRSISSTTKKKAEAASRSRSSSSRITTWRRWNQMRSGKYYARCHRTLLSWRRRCDG
uniref:Uncharacterized protein n=1 Tax=Oryza barthii TaxID=65489 RepID=A0A0D3GR52_9ORYZ